MSTPVDPEQKKKVIRWLAIGTGIIAVIIGLIVLSGVFASQRESEIKEAKATETEISGAKTLAELFVTNAGTFGLSEEAIAGQSFDYVRKLTNDNGGAYENEGFGVSRGEIYEDTLMAHIDPRGELDSTDYYAARLDSYYPDWSGQLLRYSVSDVLVESGTPYENADQTLVDVQVSFTSTTDLFKSDNPSATTATWTHYQDENFETVTITLSLQTDGTWLVWAIDDLEDYPYLLATWSETDWKISSPDANLMAPAE